MKTPRYEVRDGKSSSFVHDTWTDESLLQFATPHAAQERVTVMNEADRRSGAQELREALEEAARRFCHCADRLDFAEDKWAKDARTWAEDARKALAATGGEGDE